MAARAHLCRIYAARHPSPLHDDAIWRGQGATSCDGLAGIIAKYLPPSGEALPAVNSTSGSRGRSGVSVTQEVSAEVEMRSHTHHPHFVVRLAGSYLAAARERLTGLGVSVVDKLDEAVSKAVSLAK